MLKGQDINKLMIFIESNYTDKLTEIMLQEEE